MSKHDDAALAARQAAYAVAQDQLMQLHQHWMNDSGLTPLDILNVLINHAAFTATSVIPPGDERRASRTVCRSLASRIEHNFADPELAAIRASMHARAPGRA